MKIIDRKQLCTFITLRDKKNYEISLFGLKLSKNYKFLCLVLSFGHHCIANAEKKSKDFVSARWVVRI